MKRISRHQLMIAFMTSIKMRSACSRTRVGAMVVTPDWRQILGYGYNGQSAGSPNDCDGTTPGECGCVHAEINALVSAEHTRGMHLMTSLSPCETCAHVIINAGIARVFYREKYRDHAGVFLLTHRLGPANVLYWGRT